MLEKNLLIVYNYIRNKLEVSMNKKTLFYVFLALTLIVYVPTLSAKAGKHVVVEKPIEVTLQRGNKLVQVCEENGVALAVILQNRFLYEVITMKKMVADGGIGKLFLADAAVKWFRDQLYYDSAQWRGTFALDGGGVLINQAIHTIDLLQWIVGEVDTVFGQIGTYTHELIEGEDTAVATLCFTNGALGIIEASTSIIPARDRKIEIHGEKGTLVLDGNSLKMLDNTSSQQDLKVTETKGGSGAASPMQNVSFELHQRQFEAIFDSLRSGDQPPVSGKESMKSLAIIEGIYLSAKKGLPVKISDLPI